MHPHDASAETPPPPPHVDGAADITPGLDETPPPLPAVAGVADTTMDTPSQVQEMKSVAWQFRGDLGITDWEFSDLQWDPWQLGGGGVEGEPWRLEQENRR